MHFETNQDRQNIDHATDAQKHSKMTVLTTTQQHSDMMLVVINDEYHD